MNILLLLLLFIMSPLAFAEDDADSDKQYLLSKSVYDVVLNAQESLDAERYSEAEAPLVALLADTSIDAYEKAVIQQTLGYVYSAQDRYKKATRYFKQALDSDALPQDVSHHLRYNLAQLFIADEKYKAGIALLKQWIDDDPAPPSSAYVLLASTYYQLQDYAHVVVYIKIAINSDADPKELWQQLLLSSYLEMQQYPLAIGVLENLIESYPYQKKYWQQLSALYMQQDDDFIALAINMLVTRLELSDEKTLMNLSNMYLYLQIPYKSAQLLASGIKKGVIVTNLDNLNKLADSWLMAKEHQKAVAVLAKAAKLDKSGKTDLKHGRILFDLSLWQQAIKPLSIAMKKKTGKHVGRSSLLLGMSYVYLDDLPAAKRYFTRALKFKDEHKQAKQWLAYVKKQMKAKGRAKI